MMLDLFSWSHVSVTICVFAQGLASDNWCLLASGNRCVLSSGRVGVTIFERNI